MYSIIGLTAIIITLGFGLYITLRRPNKDSIFFGDFVKYIIVSVTSALGLVVCFIILVFEVDISPLSNQTIIIFGLGSFVLFIFSTSLALSCNRKE